MKHSAVLAGLFVVSRVALYAIGLRFEADFNWMFLPDASDLQHDLWRSLLWFHAFPPGMALLAGVVLKLGSPAMLAELVFSLSGLTLALSLRALFTRVVSSAWAPTLLAFAFVMTPPAIYLEKIFLYDHLTATLLCVAALLFVRAIEKPTHGRWFSFGLAMAVLGFLRSAFHPAWLLGVVAATSFFARVPFRKTQLAFVPMAALLAWIVKNAVLFGVLGVTSWGPANLVAVTTNQLPAAERTEWIERGLVSRYAAISVFAPPAAYGTEFEVPPGLPPQVTRLTKPTSGAGNFNHWLFLEVNRVRERDVKAYLRISPTEWLTTVFTKSLPQYLGPTTRWHPWNGRGGSHDRHHAALGGFERIYVGLLHPFGSLGVYVFMPLVLALAFRKSWKLRQRGDRALSALIGFSLLHIGVISAAACCFALGENARYRFMIEPLLWLTTTFVLSPQPASDSSSDSGAGVAPEKESRTA